MVWDPDFLIRKNILFHNDILEVSVAMDNFSTLDHPDHENKKLFLMSNAWLVSKLLIFQGNQFMGLTSLALRDDFITFSNLI